MSDLIKCPFCKNGGRPVLQTEITKMKTVYYFVECFDCECASLLSMDKDKAIKNWDHRPIEDQLRAEVERLRGELERVNQNRKEALKIASEKRAELFEKINGKPIVISPVSAVLKVVP